MNSEQKSEWKIAGLIGTGFLIGVIVMAFAFTHPDGKKVSVRTSVEDQTALRMAHFQTYDQPFFVTAVLTNYNGAVLVRVSIAANSQVGDYAVTTDTAITNGTKVNLVKITHTTSVGTVNSSYDSPDKCAIAVPVKNSIPLAGKDSGGEAGL